MILDHAKIRQLLHKEDPTILEIGAHTGEDSRRFLDEHQGIRLYCFEPDPRCIRRFKRRIKDRRCTLVESAVSNHDGKTMLHLSSGYPPSWLPSYIRFLHLGSIYLFLTRREWDASSSIKRSVAHSNDYPWLTFDRQVEVETIRLDSWITKNDITSIDFIWSDIQGAEKDMIEGAANTLKISRLLHMEFGETSPYPDAMSGAETVELLRKHDFEILPEYSSDVQARRGNLLFKNKRLP